MINLKKYDAMKTFIFISTFFFVFVFSSCQHNRASEVPAEQAVPNKSTAKIQVALLLDTSNSMDGLIDQAKSRLWNIVNTLTTLKYKGEEPQIEIALYEYGNNALSEQSGYIRQITPLTTDLDVISEMLFALKTFGGSEYCGAVISKATGQLAWSSQPSDMKLIYIAGNEEFNQGEVNYKTSVANAVGKDIFVNTIYCGGYQQGVREFWKDGADRGKGKYFNINHDAKVRYIVTPYDDRISHCNEKLNATYIAYGSLAKEKQMNQATQDENAAAVSSSNYTERVVSKSKAVYKNESWDLVDKTKEDSKALSKVKQEELPKELQGKSEAELKVIVDQKAKERETIQKEIADLAKKRQEYIDAELKKSNNVQDDLGNAINSSIVAFAVSKGYRVE